jgi:ATP-dependent Clp protease adaptor protein ClpS
MMMTTQQPETPSVKPEEKTRHAPRYKVFIHNDNKTPMEFVVFILETIFSRKGADAERIMLEAHNRGVAFVGAYSFEQAEFRVEQAHSKARALKFPLTLTYEAE